MHDGGCVCVCGYSGGRRGGFRMSKYKSITALAVTNIHMFLNGVTLVPH